VGDWEDDVQHGMGEYIWAEGAGKSVQRQICNIYRGEWVKGARNGYGEKNVLFANKNNI